ncbi:NAD(P)/FAD-dependent oxidoreductase [Pararhizobium haloflavum]|uniref:NAD(P)/FAD-dependent oxidoreductase n=1 Tax=Pararhizobium haloflavum TaxID=2037914 RepID=UPI000C1891F6|nr:FAD-binding oxidoreductase [Pararhizobium haloflavum]
MNVIIVGAGIAGLSTAWSLVRTGHQVALFEQGPIPNPLAASGDHHRIIRRAYGKAAGYGRAITEAYEAWDTMWLDLGRSHLDPRGFMCISREKGDEAEEMRDGLVDGGYEFEDLTAAQATGRFPFLDESSIRFAFTSREGGALHCRRIAADLAEWLTRHGARLHEHTRVASVDPTLGSVKTADGTVHLADRIIVTAGAWVPKLFPDVTRDLTTFRTAVAYLDPPEEFRSAWADAPTILDVGGDTDGYIIPPSGDGGLKFGSGLHKRPAADADADRSPEAGEGEAIRDLFAAPFRRLAEYRVTDVVSCAYTFTEDERFFAEVRDKVLIVSACSGHGYKFGAAVGRRAARWVDDADTAGLQRWLRAEA